MKDTVPIDYPVVDFCITNSCSAFLQIKSTVPEVIIKNEL